jgi:hypothetical protein
MFYFEILELGNFEIQNFGIIYQLPFCNNLALMR